MATRSQIVMTPSERNAIRTVEDTETSDKCWVFPAGSFLLHTHTHTHFCVLFMCGETGTSTDTGRMRDKTQTFLNIYDLFIHANILNLCVDGSPETCCCEKDGWIIYGEGMSLKVPGICRSSMIKAPFRRFLMGPTQRERGGGLFF